ncbi:hypothetical protein D3C85_1351310 [compost metagenome]
MGEEPHHTLFMGQLAVAVDGMAVEGRRIDVHARTRLHQVDPDQPDHQRQGGQYFEVQQRLEADPADAFEALHAGNATDHGAEDDRCNQHLDQLDKRVAQRLHFLAEAGVEMAEDDAEHNRQ